MCIFVTLDDIKSAIGAEPLFLYNGSKYYLVQICTWEEKMRKLVLLVTALLVGTLSYAGSSNFAKNSPSLGALATGWKATQTTNLKPGHDINFVYGGEDMSQKTSLVAPTATA